MDSIKKKSKKLNLLKLKKEIIRIIKGINKIMIKII